MTTSIDINKDEYYHKSFVYVGEENPFVTNKIKPIIWRKTNSDFFPSTNFNEYKEYLDSEQFNTLTNGKPKDIFTFEYQDYLYSLGMFNKNLRFLIVIKNNRIVFENIHYDSEWGGPAPISIEDSSEKDYQQFTGYIFKDKPPVIFGFMYMSFTCPSIHVLKSNADSISTLCDARH